MRFRLLALLTLLTGCTTTQALDATTPGLRSAINEQATRRQAVVTLRSGERMPAASLHLAPDVTTWIDPETGAGRSASTDDIVDVRFVHRRRGALEGVGAGLAAAAVGAGVALAAYPSNEWVTNTDAALIVGVGTGIPLASLGALVGAARGSRTVYARPEVEGP